ncbi:MAG TPA: thioesterase domain-containing protein [Xanthobacteraceae bacterium]|nr:thioesterase domain-containing protein [Xanthobacteraceae bacterium]
MQESPLKSSSLAPTAEARAVVWNGILGAAKHLGKRAPLPLRQRPTVVQLRQGTSETPVYFIGAGLYELNTAQMMPPRHSIFAAEIAWPAAWHDAAARNDTDATPVLEDMVVPYVTALREHAGATPCVLVGYSFHASMAFEIAHQLQATGGQVELVMILDAPAEYPLPHKAAWKNLRDTWMPGASEHAASIASRFAISLSIVRWTLTVAGRFLKRRFVESALGNPGELTTKLDTLGRPMYWPLINRLYDNSLRSYKLCRLNCRGVLFRADRMEDCPSAKLDYSLGWIGLFGKGLEIIQMTGDHYTMMREHPHDQNLAQEMSDALDRHCAKPQRATESPAAAVS